MWFSSAFASFIATVLLLAVLLWGIVIFNRLVRARNLVQAGFADIDVQLQKRHDLVPQLVEAVRAYAGYEQRVFEEVTRLRGSARQAGKVSERDGPNRRWPAASADWCCWPRPILS